MTDMVEVNVDELEGEALKAAFQHLTPIRRPLANWKMRSILVRRFGPTVRVPAELVKPA